MAESLLASTRGRSPERRDMKVKNGFTLRPLLARLSVAAVMTALPHAAVPRATTANALQESATSQVAGTPARVRSTGQQLPQSGGHQSPRASARETQKARKWTGNLADADCVGKALGRIQGIDEALLPDPLSEYWQIVEGSQRGDRPHNSGTWSPQGQPQTPGQTGWWRDSDGEPEASKRQIAMQEAQLRRVKVLEQVAKACTPTLPTVHYGLLISGGQLLKFDKTGDFKAKEAINVSPVEPEKIVKVKVTGVIEAEGTLGVASIELKGRIPPPRASSGK